MPFDPAFPPHGAGLISADWRDQFNSLKDLCDTQAAQISALESAMAAVQAQLPNLITQADMEPLAANNIDSVAELSLSISDPPTASQVDEILNKLNEAVSGLHR